MIEQEIKAVDKTPLNIILDADGELQQLLKQ